MFVQEHAAAELAKLDSFRAGDHGKALSDLYMHMDDLLRDPQHREELVGYGDGPKGGGGAGENGGGDDDDDDGLGGRGAASGGGGGGSGGGGPNDEIVGMLQKMLALKRMAEAQNAVGNAPTPEEARKNAEAELAGGGRAAAPPGIPVQSGCTAVSCIIAGKRGFSSLLVGCLLGRSV